jgi:peptide deformylase
MGETEDRLADEERSKYEEARLQRRRVALESVRQWGDPVLRSIASEVTSFDSALAAEVQLMAELMEHASGVGLAAPQIGSLRRTFVYRIEQDAPATVLVNPRIVWTSDEEELALEGCLSLVDGEFALQISRPVEVRVEAFSVHGRPLTVEAEGLEARVIQHENDHLDGVLILDRAHPEERREALRSLREASEQAVAR